MANVGPRSSGLVIPPDADIGLKQSNGTGRLMVLLGDKRFTKPGEDRSKAVVQETECHCRKADQRDELPLWEAGDAEERRYGLPQLMTANKAAARGHHP